MSMWMLLDNLLRCVRIDVNITRRKTLCGNAVTVFATHGSNGVARLRMVACSLTFLLPFYVGNSKRNCQVFASALGQQGTPPSTDERSQS